MSIQPEKTKLDSEHKHSRPLTNCVWDPLSRYVFCGAEDNGVHRFDVSHQTFTRFDAHDSWIRALGISPDGKWMVSGGYDGRLAAWPADATEPKPISIVDAHQGWIRAVAISPGGEQIATCGNDRLVKIWNAHDLSLTRQFSGHSSHVYNIGFTKDGSRLMSCDLHGVVKSWMLATNEANANDKPTESTDVVKAESLTKYDTTFRADIGGARGLAFSEDGNTLALAGITNVSNAFAGVGEVAVVLVDWPQSKIKLQLECKDKQRGTAWGVAYHRDGFWIGASGGSGGFLIFWKGDTAHEVFKLKLKHEARGMSLSPDGTKIAVAHADSQLRIYSLV